MVQLYAFTYLCTPVHVTRQMANPLFYLGM